MKEKNINLRLILMLFLEFAVWGAYLTSMGSFLAKAGLGPKISIFYAMQGIVSIFMPALIGIIADKWIPAQKTLSLCHLIAGLSMFGAGLYAMKAGESLQFGPLFTLYAISVAFFMPTIAISNSVSYSALEGCGKDPVKDFPRLRIFGTIGFICAMFAVNFVKNGSGVQFQNSYEQFMVSGVLSLLLAGFALTLPNCPCKPKGEGSQSFADATGLSAFKLFKNGQFAVFFIFSMLLGASLHITNGYANPFINSFASNPEFAHTWGANNANVIISIGQISETVCILLIPFFMKKFGIKKVMLLSMFAWVFRFGLFGLGNPGSGVWLFILSGLVYGVAFDFFNVSGSLYVNENTDSGIRSSAQGLFMLMTNGLGATIGTLVAGKVINALVYQPQAIEGPSAGNWQLAWFIFAGYALVVGILFAILFKDPQKKA